MDEKRLLKACLIRDEGMLKEAADELLQLAETEKDPLDKAGILLHLVNTLELSGETEVAASKLSLARTLLEGHSTSQLVGDDKFAALELFLDYEDANLSWLRGDNLEVALTKFETLIKKHRLRSLADKQSTAPKDVYLLDFCESSQIRRAFILADLGRWKEALTVLEAIRSPKEYREGIAFYLGHCYLAAHNYGMAERKLTEALRFGSLPISLEFRAHCELGMTYYNLGDYAKAKQELEKGAALASPSYLKESQVWKWLELTCRALGLKQEADDYSHMARPS
jgi:tetratricopeptide (TPR) repeat protein